MIGLSSIKTSMWFEKIRAAFDVVSVLVHMCVIPAAVIIPFTWLTQNTTVTEISAPTLAVVRAGETLPLDESAPRVHLSTDARKVAYSMVLEDQKNRVVYQYKSAVVDASELRLSEKRVSIPKNLPTGTYSLVVETEYAVNPFKTSRTRMEIAQIQVY